ncbi:MAG TPA: MarR family transcriptional regulator [Gemmatimonadaceae bacterium]|nr:MarR family transcriptional regulator [Gemmatimonadaceae bacterium]
MGSNTILQTHPSPQIVEALGAIRRFVRVLRTGAVATERSTGLSAAQLLVLQLLMESDADSVNDLAKQTMTDQSSVSAVVARLEEKGFVSRTPSKADARRTIVSITQSGETVLQGAPQTLQERLVFALRQMPANSLHTLASDLSQMATLMGATTESSPFLFEDDATGSP